MTIYTCLALLAAVVLVVLQRTPFLALKTPQTIGLPIALAFIQSVW